MGKFDNYGVIVNAILVANDIMGNIKHKVKLDANTGVSLSVVNGATPVSDGDEVAFGTTLSVTATLSTGYSLPVLTINGVGATSGDSFAVMADGGEDVVFYACATPNVYTITYLDGTTPLTGAPASYTYGVGATLPETAPAKTGYTFGGWYSDAEFTSAATTVSNSATGDKTFYAKYTINTYDLTETDAEASTGTIVLKDADEQTVTAGTDKLTHGETYDITITPADATTYTATATNGAAPIELTDTEGVFTGTFVCTGDVALSIVAIETAE